MRIVPLDKRHYTALHEIVKASEPWPSVGLEEFRTILDGRLGYTILNGKGEIIGTVNFSEHVPKCNALIHCYVLPRYQRRWCTRAILAEIGDYAFNVLKLKRISGISIIGKTDDAGKFLEALGFKKEGIIRQGFMFPDKCLDVKLYGMLRNECRWIKG
jgi:RimJ/RimL family protein N-acetyltransferase